ncbi:hypothetical protein K3555_10770 [Leisingera sp. M527]|uniref:hypothetical protein n=1 Tax=Leisingera sp. M527 TaxID=2867014 RepID=UPI0021A87DF0|nr:hypothetical protein [Leisingera sp. M527]UWQ31110.1 hypothetical protein K3555_10770 [Leisingera sp. M527]
MTHSPHLHLPHIQELDTGRLRAFRISAGVALPLILAVSAGNLLDPIVRFDDYPALLARPDGFWPKTLHEGRWLNYLWHLRGLVTPPWLNFALFQVLWALTAAAIAATATRDNNRTWFTIALTLTLLPAPPVFLMAGWSSTVIPGFALLALYGFLALTLRQATLRLLLPLFTLLAFTAYTTFPLILFAICLIRTQQRSIRDLAGLVVLFGLSFAGAVLAVYALNWQVHGVFGIPLAPARSPDPALDLAGFWSHLPQLRATVSVLLDKLSFQSAPVLLFHAGMLTAATAVLLRRQPMETLYIWVALWAGMALMTLQVLKLGVTIPARAFHFTWIIYAVMIVRAAQELSRKPGLPGRLARNAVLLVAASYLVQTAVQFTRFRDWQVETRAMAAAIAVSPKPVFVTGDILNYPSAAKAGLHMSSSLANRLELLTGRAVILCQAAPQTCADLPESLRRPAAERTPKARLEDIPDAMVLVFPPLP